MCKKDENGSCVCQPACHKILCLLGGVLLIILAVYLTGLARNAWKTNHYIGKSAEAKDRITISGEGKVAATPDIAQISLGLVTKKSTVAEAQKENTQKMNAIVSSLKKDFKVNEKDISTTVYQINPQYDWSSRVQQITGYSINQSVSVKVRDFAKIGDILAKAGELGANSISGPNFTVDEPEKYREQAREKAIKQAKDKAKILAHDLGIGLGPVVNFSEGVSGAYYPLDRMMSFGVAAGAAEKALPAPTIEAGSQEVAVSVSISYEIR